MTLGSVPPSLYVSAPSSHHTIGMVFSSVWILMRSQAYGASCIPAASCLLTSYQLVAFTSPAHTSQTYPHKTKLGCVSPPVSLGKYTHTCITHYTKKRNTQGFISWSIEYSTTWIILLQNQIDHALLHICLCIHMQCTWLHVCMSMRPMVFIHDMLDLWLRHSY